jgi:hypothetical protein
MPPLQASGDRTNAEERLPVLLRLRRLRATPQAEARRLLRVLFVRVGALPTDANGTAPPLSNTQPSKGQRFAMFEVLNIV